MRRRERGLWGVSPRGRGAAVPTGLCSRTAGHSLAHLLPCSRWALMMTASSHWLKGSFLTSGLSWLHHLRAKQGGRGQPAEGSNVGGRRRQHASLEPSSSKSGELPAPPNAAPGAAALSASRRCPPQAAALARAALDAIGDNGPVLGAMLEDELAQRLVFLSTDMMSRQRGEE